MRTDILLGMPLFADFSGAELLEMLACLEAESRRYSRGEVILMAGAPVTSFGVVMAGQVRVYRVSAAGRRTLMSVFGPGETFAEVLVCAGVHESPVTVEAVDAAEVLHLHYGRVLTVCSAACTHHARLVANMLRVLARKNLLMNRKIDYLNRRRLRARVAAYLLERMAEEKSVRFPAGMGRAELADFLHADRSALSRELSRMQKDGLIACTRTHFEVLDEAALADADRTDAQDG